MSSSIKKQMFAAGFEYKLNNHVAYLEIGEDHKDFHNIMGFLKQSKVAYAMTAAPTPIMKLTR
ncbi:hypothetical protein DCAR_0623363 [Daucus carota subsp. sativus]|uniref:Uncharacterized protein n=1 Tax=Daucus carota subsp. sativus TaxID=79200 RepID=A0A175YAP6_DAUCS|nr:hypothetical protein DCAR_0623363 [Daucus carota subsp. sativus]